MLSRIDVAPLHLFSSGNDLLYAFCVVFAPAYRHCILASFGNVLFSVLLLFFLQYADVWRRSRNVLSGIFCVHDTKRFKINGSPRDSSNSKTYIVLAIERYLQPSQRVQQKHHPKGK